MTLLLASFYPSPLAPHIESISSINIIEGFFSLAILKRLFIKRSDSPTNLEIKSDDETEKNVPSASVAQAFARKVFPVPGGPNIRIPFHGVRAPSNI